MEKAVFILRKAQKATTGENVIIEREVETTFKGKGNLGRMYIHGREEFPNSFGYTICQDIWDSLADIDGEPSDECIRVTITVEPATPDDFNKAVK